MPNPYPHLAALTLAAILPASMASAQLTESQTLLVYDSRIADSKAIAEFYAGSAQIPGSTTGQPGVHPGISVVDISTLGATGGGQAGVFPQAADITYATFTSRLRNPIRTYLSSNQLTQRIRCIVLTTGIPHRVQNIDSANPTIGDNPTSLNNYINAGRIGNITYCSVDAELTLLNQSLDAGETGNNADSRADGMILNPYFRSVTTINGYPNKFTSNTKTWLSYGAPYTGFVWLNSTNLAASTTLTAGDLYLVCRLDGNSVADVQAMVNRAQNLVLPTLTARFLLDSDGRTFDGTPIGNPNDFPAIDVGPDYAFTRDALQADARFPFANVRFDPFGLFVNFYVGPNLDFSTQPGGPPMVIPQSLLLVASFGSNHGGVDATTARTTYAGSFNYLPGAVFNSIESYNGRKFNGLPGNPFVPQQQIADALSGANGATFAPGNVWEPFSFTISDNEQIVKNFFLGNMTWAEAAYSSLPVLSWQQIVVGDPLARPRRDREDINADNRITIDDLYAWHATPVDLNNSGVADSTDAALLESSIRAYDLANMKAGQR